MTDGDAVQCWLVEREYDDRDLVTLTYATPDGTQQAVYQRASTLLSQRPATAAVQADSSDLTPVTDEATQQRYEQEVTRMMNHHDPDDTV